MSCRVPVAVLEPGPLLELENAGECWRMLEIPEVQSLAILNFLNLEHLWSAGYLFLILIKACSRWLCANMRPEIMQASSTWHTWMNQPAYSGVDNYDSMIHCVCVRACMWASDAKGIKCWKKMKKGYVNVSQNSMTCRLSSPTYNIPTMLNLGVCVSTKKNMTLGVVLWGRKCQPALPGFKHPSSPSNCL